MTSPAGWVYLGWVYVSLSLFVMIMLGLYERAGGEIHWTMRAVTIAIALSWLVLGYLAAIGFIN